MFRVLSLTGTHRLHAYLTFLHTNSKDSGWGRMHPIYLTVNAVHIYASVETETIQSFSLIGSRT